MLTSHLTSNSHDTIAAIATPTGKGGIGIVRVSGPLSRAIAQSILKQIPEPRKVHFGNFYDDNGVVIDQGLALFFAAPHSFTGEDVLELQGHGGPVVLNQLLRSVVEQGARLAKPGEFSERAFLNEKLDLSQAEAIADLINAVSEKAARSAVRSLQGEFSRYIYALVDLLVELRAYVEGAIDFPEDDVDFLALGQVETRLQHILDELEKVTKAAKQGAILREGITVVIAGKPNVGKSSLLNALSGRESAIVTPIAGTTRDVIREYIQIDGIPLHVLDTAGLQETDNPIEQEGIRRTWQEVEKADHILVISDVQTDAEKTPEELWPEFFSRYPHKHNVTMIQNKIDLAGQKPEIFSDGEMTWIYLSAKTEQGVDLLRQHLKEVIGFEEQTEDVFMARARHLDALQRAKNFLYQAQQELNVSHELVAENLRLAQLVLSEITGEFTTEDLLSKIFSSFCIGK